MLYIHPYAVPTNHFFFLWRISTDFLVAWQKFHAIVGSAGSQTSKILQANEKTANLERQQVIRELLGNLCRHISTLAELSSCRKHSTMAAIDAGDPVDPEKSKAANAGACPSMAYQGLPPKC